MSTKEAFKPSKLNQLQALYKFVGKPGDNGLRAVCDRSNKWFHVNEDGIPAYKERYSWVGRFTNGQASVSNKNRENFCINTEGKIVNKKVFIYSPSTR